MFLAWLNQFNSEYNTTLRQEVCYVTQLLLAPYVSPAGGDINTWLHYNSAGILYTSNV